MKQTAFVLRTDGFDYAPAIDPLDALDYTLDFTEILAGDTITGTPAWSATAGITIDTPKNTNTTTSATVWLKSGTLGGTFTVECTAVTNGGRTFNRAFKIECANQ